MLFLKQIRAKGFKSFADSTILDFTHDMIGVVGPNGSGKSNITDAIRWALGEQSAKSLRGGNLDDVVFSGSVDHPALDVAEVTLIFDNQKGFFPQIDSDVIEITRRFNKKTRDSDFYINGERVKMRDIQDFALETGLTKSSIAIISQGTISQFTEAKPEQRREIFDEAAGVAKYKKRKREATTKLIRAMENYKRLEDIANEIGRRLPNLERQAKRATAYRDKIAELQKYEMTILVTDAQNFKVKIDQLEIEKADLTAKVKSLVAEINTSQQELDNIFSEANFSEKSITDLNKRFNQIVERLGDLKVKKVEAENRESAKNQNAAQDEVKAREIRKTYEERRISLQAETDKINQWTTALNDLKIKYDSLTQKYNQIYEEIEKIRHQQMKVKYAQENFERQKSTNNFGGPLAGVQAVINHKNNLSGVIGTLLSLVTVKLEYQVAISVVASGSMHSIVMQTNQDVKQAIEFLKRNQAGRATFLPLDTLNPSTIQGMQKSAIAQEPGFVGFANHLVEIKPEYQVALDYALGTVIVVNNYDSALKLAHKINYRFNIVTLEGERILPHGAIIGGKIKNQNIFTNLETKDTPNFSNSLEELEQQELDCNQELNNYKVARDKARDEINNFQSNIRVSQEQIEIFETHLQGLSDDYRLLTGKSLTKDDQDSQTNELESVKIARQIAKLELERDNLQIERNSLTSTKNKYAERQLELNETNNQKRQVLDGYKDSLSVILAQLGQLTAKQEQYLTRLTQSYHLTPETVYTMTVEKFSTEDETQIRDRIQILTQEISHIGHVNLDSIAEYEEEKGRFDYYEVQRKEILEAVEKLESIIKDIDIAMETQFKKVVDDVNLALPEAFKKLFGGGSAKLIYTLPDNILETGIDIEVNPPGKKISHLNLLSGGEKSLVALSVLFSILKVRPLPLVILDEAEAPLDPANVERFARYVQQFTKDTQFIIVTHREGTMENCEVLFGVTMETQGITKIVKIKLIDAKQLAIHEDQQLQI